MTNNNKNNNEVQDGLLDAMAWALVFARTGLRASPLNRAERVDAAELVTDTFSMLINELGLSGAAVRARADELAPLIERGAPAGATLH